MINGAWERRDWLAVAAVSLLGVIVYLGSVGHEFVYDDVMLFGQRPQLRSLSDPWGIISSTWWVGALYRPFTQLALAFDWQLSGGAPQWFHIVNVVLNGIAAGMVFVLARRWLPWFGAAGAAAVFAVHPVHVEAVANVVGRAEVYVTIFAILAALLYAWDGDLARQRDTSWRRWVASIGTLLALVLGLASKESGFAIPGILLIVDWIDAKQRGISLAEGVKPHTTLWFAAVVLSVEWLLLRSMVVGDLAGDQAGPGLLGETLWGRSLIMAPVVLQYLRLFLFPVHLSADYSPNYIDVDSGVTPATITGLLLVAGCIVGAVAVRNRYAIVPFALMWTGGSLLVVSNLIVPTGVILAERSMYLPSVGIVLILGWAAGLWRPSAPRIVTAVAAAVVVLGAVRTVTRVPVWKNADTFFPRLVQDAPGSFRSLWVAGMLHYNLGDRNLGEQLVREALRVYPLYANTWHDLGTLLEEQARWHEAGGAYATAYRIDTTRIYDAANAVSSFIQAGDLDTARVLVRRISRTDRNEPNVQAAIGDLAMGEGRPLEAMTWYRQAVWQGRSPRQRQLHSKLARAAALAGQCAQFRMSLERLQSMNHGDAGIQELKDLAASANCDVADEP